MKIIRLLRINGKKEKNGIIIGKKIEKMGNKGMEEYL